MGWIWVCIMGSVRGRMREREKELKGKVEENEGKVEENEKKICIGKVDFEIL